MLVKGVQLVRKRRSVDVETLDLIVLAAGKSTRIDEPVAKQFLDLCGKPIIIHALTKFEQLSYVGTKYIAVHRDDADLANHMLRKYEITNFEIVYGGATRQDSVRLSLEHARTKRVITHNAALPFVTQTLIDQVVREDFPCVTTVTPVHQSLCRGGEFAEEIVPPQHLMWINTPQSFQTEAFRECHRRANQDRLVVRTDCELMLHYGYQVKFVPGVPENFKITTRLDLILARALSRSDNGRPPDQ